MLPVLPSLGCRRERQPSQAGIRTALGHAEVLHDSYVNLTVRSGSSTTARGRSPTPTDYTTATARYVPSQPDRCRQPPRLECSMPDRVRRAHSPG